MNFSKIIFLGTLLGTAPLWAGLSINDSGSFTVGDLRARFKCAAGTQWKSAIQDDLRYFTVVKKEGGTLESKLDMSPELKGVLRQSFRKTGVATWVYDLEFTEAPGYTAVHVAVDMSAEAERFVNKEMLIDGVPFKFPAEVLKKQNPFHLLWKKTKSVTFILENSSVTFSSSKEFGVLIQDDRATGGSVFTVRLVLPEKNVEGKYLQSFTITEKTHKIQPLDLRKAFNSSFWDETADDQQGGWTDQGATNDLRGLPYQAERPNIGEIPFKLVDPATNQGKSCIVLRGSSREYFPAGAATGIADEVSGRCLYLLHALAWPIPGAVVGHVTLEFADGTNYTISVSCDHDVGNWWEPEPLTNGAIAWSDNNRSAVVGLYRSRFLIPAKPIRHISFNSSGTSVWMIVAATVTSEIIPETTTGGPVFIQEGAEWKAIRLEKDAVPGGVLDFSASLEAPAGKYGPVVSRNGHFEFRDRPGVPVRFYGTNLVDSAQFLSREWAEKLADRMAQAGFNLVRIHHHDNGLSVRENGSSTSLNMKNLDALNYLIACLKKRGIYIITDCYVSRTFTPEEILRWGSDDFKKLVFLNADALENWKTFVENWFTAINPYTGVALKDEPALVGVTLVNEGCIGCGWNDVTNKMLQEQFRMQKKNGSDTPPSRTDKESAFYDPQIAQFVVTLYNKAFQEMRRFLRDDLGVNAPISDRSVHAEWLMAFMREQYDFVDNHYYYDHPKYPYTAWMLPGVIKNTSSLSVSSSDLNGMFPSRQFGKPFAVTEFDYPKPNFFRAEGGVLPAAYAGLQDWDALVQFACSHGDYNIVRDQVVGGPFDLYSDVVKFHSHRIGIKLFLGNEIKPAPVTVATLFDKNCPEAMSFSQLPSRDLHRLGLVARIGTAVVPSGKLAAPLAGTGKIDAFLDAGTNFPKGVAGHVPVFLSNTTGGQLFDALQEKDILPEGTIDPAYQVYRATGGQLVFDAEKQTFSAWGNGINVLILPAGNRAEVKHLRVDNRIGRGVFSLQSIDGKKLEESCRMLFLHLTDSQATRLKFDNGLLKQYSSYGKAPHLAARGEADIRIALKGDFTLYSCDTAGKRLAEVPLSKEPDGTIRFQAKVFRPEGSVFVYELFRN